MLVAWVFLIMFVAVENTDIVSAPDMYSLTVPESPIVASPGSSVTLPCAVSPTFSVVPFKVRWHRPGQFETPVLLYENKKLQLDPADTGYWGRVSLVGSLEQGNISMKLENLELADRGLHVCYVKTPLWYEEANVTLHVEVMGSIPVLSVSKGVEEKVNVTCMSDGWSPQPKLTWTRRGEMIEAYGTVYTTDDEGLVAVSSWLLHSPSESEWLSCSVSQSGQERKNSKEGRVLPFVYTSHIGAVIGGVSALLVLVILVPVTVVIYRQKNSEKKAKEKKMAEMELLVDDAKGVLQKQVEITTRRLTRNGDLVRKLKIKIDGTLKELHVKEDCDPLNLLLTKLSALEEQNQELADNLKILKTKVATMRKNAKRREKEPQVDLETGGAAPEQDDEKMAVLYLTLSEISTSIAYLEEKVVLAELLNQMETTRRLHKEKADVLGVLQEQIRNTIKGLSDNEESVKNLKCNIKKTLKTLQEQKDKAPLENLLKTLDEKAGETVKLQKKTSILQGDLKKQMDDTQSKMEKEQTELKEQMDNIKENKEEESKDPTYLAADQQNVQPEKSDQQEKGKPQKTQKSKAAARRQNAQPEKGVQQKGNPQTTHKAGKKRVQPETRGQQKRERQSLAGKPPQNAGHVPLSVLQQRLDRLKNSVICLDKEVFQIKYQYQMDERRGQKQENDVEVAKDHSS